MKGWLWYRFIVCSGSSAKFFSRQRMPIQA